jgi:hypothetical protein
VTPRLFSLNVAPFAGRTGRGVIVAVVDSGVHVPHPHVPAVRGGIDLTKPNGRADFSDRLGHGTAVSAAIIEKAPDAELLAVKVFGSALATSAETLARAIIWSAQNGARLVNLSLGTSNTQHAELLRDAVAQASALGALVVSARELDGQVWLPGALPLVAGVEVDWACDRDTFTLAAEPSSHDVIFRASGFPRPIPGVPRERNLSGISFAVANVTGFLARLLEHAPGIRSLEHVRQHLSVF